MLQAQLQKLLAQGKYRQAIDEIKKIQRSAPDAKLSYSEADVWHLRGKHELEKGEFKAAENSFRQVLKLGITGDIYYWLSKALLGQNRLDAAIDLVRHAFETKTLPKEYGICYLKLLLIKGDRPTVETLIKTEAKRFMAPQLHWVRGVLALQSGDTDAATTAFTKVKKPLTPSDSPDAWIAYAYQQQQNWDAAAAKLGLNGSSSLSRIFGRPAFTKHPMLQKLAILQQSVAGDLREVRTAANDRSSQELLTALSVVQLMEEGNFHDAGHGILQIRSPSARTADLMALKPKLLKISGQQAMAQGETSCALQLWEPILPEKELPLQLLVNVSEVLGQEEEYQERQRILTRLIKSIEQDAKKNPTGWPEQRLKKTLAHAHCLIADCWVDLEQGRAVKGAVLQAQRLCPTSPEVIGRLGLIAVGERRDGEAIPLLTQALEEGCQSREVYEALIETLEEHDQHPQMLEVRKRHGQRFGDMKAETEGLIEPWIEAVSTQGYGLFSHMLPLEESSDPPLLACQIFREAAQGNPTAKGRISIDQAQATEAWDNLLMDIEVPLVRLQTLQAIALTTEVLAKRDKGIAALITRYVAQIIELTHTLPEANVANIIFLAVKEKKPDKLRVPVKAYFNASPQPGNALASLQLQVRWFATTAILGSFLDDALKQEPQNPLLLLAKATTFDVSHPSYEKLRAQGFDLARRLQDAQALQAFRVEDFYVKKQQFQAVVPDFDRLDDMMPDEFEDMIERMIRATVGKDIPKAELDRILPMLKAKFLAEMGGGGDDEDIDDDEDFNDFFGRSRPQKRKRSFMDL